MRRSEFPLFSSTVASLTCDHRYIFSVMFSPTIMLLIGGFTIASALSKTAIDRVLITKVLSLAGTRPSVVLLAFMGVACFASMWISNVAAPTLCFTLVQVNHGGSFCGLDKSLISLYQPILRTLPPKSSFAPCLIVGAVSIVTSPVAPVSVAPGYVEVGGYSCASE